jgi:TRAP-type C4-dicarboxylate transport system substrate-binding protein
MSWRLAVLLALTVVLAGCFGDSEKTKSGVRSTRAVTLTMPVPDSDDADAAYFAAEVARRTDGHVRITLDKDTYSSVNADNELQLVKDLRAGRVPIGYVPSRAFERDGINGFQALQAPLLVGDYRTLKTITSGDVGQSMLHSLDGAGLVGLALVPKELRRPLGRRPLVTAAAFRGARIRVPTSPTSELALRTLGARPVTDLDAHQARDALAEQTLDGVESDLNAIGANGYAVVAPYLTDNLALFAKAEVLAIRKDVLDRMSRADQDAVRAAARAAAERTDPAAAERSELANLCAAGVKLVSAPAREVASIRRAAQRIYPKFDGEAVAAIRALAGPGQATLPRCPKAALVKARSRGHFPEGVYESPITHQEYVDSGQQPPFVSPWRITIRNGRWRTNENPNFMGPYIVEGDKITFLITSPPEAAGQRDVIRWNKYRGKLKLKALELGDPNSSILYELHPWKKIG